jgi:hypothetical protein
MEEQHIKFHGVIGDMNPIEHDGGVVYTGEYGTYVRYFQGWSDGEGPRVSVYDFCVEDDVGEDLTWVDWKSVAECVGLKEEELRAYFAAPNPLARAQVYESVAAHYGFGELDSMPRKMTPEEAEKEFGEFVDAAHG